MAKKIQLSIPTPCHENWEAMTPVEKGRFCGSCQKQVVDFSTMSDRQVAAFFKKPSTGSVCGRFLADQLDRDMEIPRKRIPWLKYFFTIALPAFFMSVKASAERTQGKIRVKTETNQKPVRKTMGAPAVIKCEQLVTLDTVVMPEVVVAAYPAKIGKITSTKINTLEGRIAGPVISKASECKVGDISQGLSGRMGGVIVSSTNEISGRVIDSQNKGIPYASIFIKGTKDGVVADKDGYFNIRVSKPAKNITLEASSVGFMKTERILSGEMLDSNIPIVLEIQETVYTGEVVLTVGMIARKPVKKKKAAKPIAVIPGISAKPAELSFRLFPNPIPAGSSLTIECRQTEEGYYTLQLIDAGGKAVHQQELWIDAEARLLNVAVPVVRPGSYFLILTAKSTGKRFFQKIVIQ